MSIFIGYWHFWKIKLVTFFVVQWTSEQQLGEIGKSLFSFLMTHLVIFHANI